MTQPLPPQSAEPFPPADGPGIVTVELLGLSRFLARREEISVTLGGTVPSRELVAKLAAAVPTLVGVVAQTDGTLLGGHVLARESGDLLRPEGAVAPGERLLLLSTAAGG